MSSQQFFFVLTQIFLIGFVWRLFLILLFKVMPGRIDVSIKKRKYQPRIKDKKVKKLIADGKFKFIGYRYETIFKIFKLRYLLFKNDQNIYLDLTPNNKFYYISYRRDGRGYFYFSPSFQVRQYEDQGIKVEVTHDFQKALLNGEEVSREALSELFYREASSLFSISFLIMILLFILLYITQFIYLAIVLL